MPIVQGVMDIFGSVIDFITGVFSGNWEQAWDGIVGIFKGIFNLIPTIVEGVINGAIAIINGIISGINALTALIGIPEIPKIPNVQLPRFHAGGIVDFEAGEGPAPVSYTHLIPISPSVNGGKERIRPSSRACLLYTSECRYAHNYFYKNYVL